MTRLAIGLFLIAHGLVHAAVWATPKPKDGKAPFEPGHSWLIGTTKGLSAVLAIVVGLVLVAGGIALFSQAELWRPITVVGLAGSLLLDVLYFNPWLIFIGVVNGAFIWALVWAHWPSAGSVGA